MLIYGETLDDLLRNVYKRLLKSTNKIVPSRKAATEIIGASLRLGNPLARISRSEKRGALFSGLGELFWYLAGSDSLDFIAYYIGRYVKESDDGVTLYGAYGPRLKKERGINQIENVLDLLRKKRDSRRAVIQLFRAEDNDGKHTEIPCTCTIQFFSRRGRLHMLTYMRSNDAYFGLPHDVFTFTMIHELFARELKLKLGNYRHVVGSLHLYDEHRKSAQSFVDEDYQARIPMPPMPLGSPWLAVEKVLSAERAARVIASEVSLIDTKKKKKSQAQVLLVQKSLKKLSRLDREMAALHPYWLDLVRLFMVFGLFKSNGHSKIKSVKKRMDWEGFNTYVVKKQFSAPKEAESRQPTQGELFGAEQETAIPREVLGSKVHGKSKGVR
jgi:thymidylate synthase